MRAGAPWRTALALAAALLGCRDYDYLNVGPDQSVAMPADLATVDLAVLDTSDGGGACGLGARLDAGIHVPTDMLPALSARSLTPIGAIDRATEVALADYDGDGRKDVLTLHLSPDFLSWSVARYHNDGAQLTPVGPLALTNPLTSFAVADLDGDGRAELVGLVDRPGEPVVLTVYTGLDQGTPAKTAIPFKPPGRLRKALLANVDRDGHLDLVIGINNWTGAGPFPPGELAIFWGTGTASWFEPVTTTPQHPTIVHDMPVEPTHIAVADLDGDCRREVIVGWRADPSSGKNLAIVRFAGRRPINELLSNTLVSNMDGLDVGDFDRDGRDELALATALEVHELVPGEEYFLAAFLVGAYQETLGDLHNLFGDTHVVHIRLDDAHGWWIEEIIKGDTARAVLGYMQYDPGELYPRFARDCERAMRDGSLSVAEGQALKRFYESELAGYTYLEPDGAA
jgi:hypothetical protein